MTERSRSKAENDVVELLIRQHREIRRLFDKVESSEGEDREKAFHKLRRLLAVHETAEEEIVHPNARRVIKNGARVVGERLIEENRGKQMLSELERLGPDAPEFLPRLVEFRQVVVDHSDREEREEFPALRENCSEQRLWIMATAVKAAEALAPTHPHPGVESAGANLITGPFMAVVDRTRDLVRKRAKRS
jgi:hemerythrin superfamily protein